MKMRLSRALCLMLAMLLMLAVLPENGVQAETAKTMYIGVNIAKVYKNASTTRKTLGKMYYGEAITVIGTSDSGRAIVRSAKGKVGYCEADALVSGNPNTLNKVVYAQLKKVSIYAGCSTKTKKLKTVRRDTAMVAVAITPEGDWVRVYYNGVYGYVRKPFVDTALYAEGTAGYCTYDGNVAVWYTTSRTGELGTISLGDKVWVLDEAGSYTKIRNSKGWVGYCASDAIGTESPGLAIAAYTQVSGKYLYSKPGGSTSALSKRKLKKNAKVAVVMVSGYWARVIYKKKVWFIPRIYLDTEKVSGSGRTVETTAEVDMYEKVNLGGKLLATIPKDIELRLVGASGIHAKVTTMDGMYTGWVLATQLKDD